MRRLTPMITLSALVVATAPIVAAAADQPSGEAAPAAAPAPADKTTPPPQPVQAPRPAPSAAPTPVTKLGQPANEQVIEPQVDRRNVAVPHIHSSDIELGAFAGTYNAENFGSSSVTGLRLGYHVTEDIFFESAFGQTKISDQAFRQILPGGIFPLPKEKLTYYNLSVGFNLFPGEVFVGKNYAMVSSVYLIAGIGSTKFLDERHQTVNAGVGMRLLMADWVALQVDLRDHVFALDMLGTRKTTQNFELTGGLTFFF